MPRRRQDSHSHGIRTRRDSWIAVVSGSPNWHLISADLSLLDRSMQVGPGHLPMLEKSQPYNETFYLDPFEKRHKLLTDYVRYWTKHGCKIHEGDSPVRIHRY
jgi:hypothetical protein